MADPGIVAEGLGKRFGDVTRPVPARCARDYSLTLEVIP
jgi:hypothetical protein